MRVVMSDLQSQRFDDCGAVGEDLAEQTDGAPTSDTAYRAGQLDLVARLGVGQCHRLYANLRALAHRSQP